MFGIIKFFKAEPTEYIFKYAGGKVASQGQGIAFYYLTATTSIVSVPTGSVDVNFIFNEMTSNFQAVTLQGQFVYRIVNPQRATELFKFTIDPRSRGYLSDDLEKLKQRITNVIQIETRREALSRSLEETLRQSEEIAAIVSKRVREQTLLETMGVELMSLFFQAVKPTPEVAKALEAEQREHLLRTADEAIYARRAAAVGEERKIKENELKNKIALEEQREKLLKLEGENAQSEADFRGKASELEAQYHARVTELELNAYREIDARKLLALGIRDLGKNAAQIGNLTITSEMISSILNHTKESEE